MSLAEIADADRDDVARFIEREWLSRKIMSRGKVYYPHEERGFIQRRAGAIVGLLTYRIEDEAMEVLTLNSTLEGHGIGTGLILASIQAARKQQCSRIWLTTTNDNLRAIGFYQRLGFRMTAVNVGAVDEARKIKPEIPEVGERGIPIHDEIVMELSVEPYIEP